MMQQIAIVGLIASNIIFGTMALWPSTPKKPDWQTLVIYRDDDYKLVAMQWMPGAWTKAEIEKLPKAFTGMRVMENFTVPGRPMDAEWVQSVNGAAPID